MKKLAFGQQQQAASSGLFYEQTKHASLEPLLQPTTVDTRKGTESRLEARRSRKERLNESFVCGSLAPEPIATSAATQLAPERN